MAKNRLNLNFSLVSNEERAEFVTKYLEGDTFSKKPPTPEELETIANYILWGKDADGKNVVQRKEIEIETRNQTWTKKAPESLDALLETPTFNENTIATGTTAPTKQKRVVFDREKALHECPTSLQGTFLDLFEQIDELDLIINFYDLAHEKRKNPPRQELLDNFTPERIEHFKEKSIHLNQYQYLKMRHLLVELRKEQFAIKDTYSTPILIESQPSVTTAPSTLTFESDIPVLPCGLYYAKALKSTVFRPESELLPSNFSEKELDVICHDYWERHDVAQQADKTFDFRDLEHVYNLFLQFFELTDAVQLEELDSTTSALLNTLNYYIELANLSDIQKDILELKKNKVRNQDIACIVNKKYSKTYTANYISTIFRQKIIKQINEAAMYHERIILSLPYPENFKTCSTCGRVLLRDSQNFVKKTRAKDGFTGRCKQCDKIDRQKKK